MNAKLRVLVVASALAVLGTVAPSAVEGDQGADRERREAEGRSDETVSPRAVAIPSVETRSLGGGADLLLIPDSAADRVMAFDPVTGNLVNADFVPANNPNLQTPKVAFAHTDNASVLVVDQISDAVQRYSGGGSYVGLFAPAGGVNTAILDNATCGAYRPNGNVLVCVTGGANQDSVAEFDATGAHVGNFIAIGAGGLDGPFDVHFRAADVLVPSINTDQILRYDLNGAFLGVFTAINNFPEQIAEAANSNVLVANFGGTEEGIVEYTAAGVFVGRYDPPGLSGYRGVYELPNANILVTTGSGVHEITRLGTLVATKIAVTGAQYIERVQGLVPVELQGFTIE